MPLRVKDLPVEVKAVYTYLVFALPACGRHPLVAQHPAQSAHVSGRLVAVVCLGLAVKDTEEVVVCSCDNLTVKHWSRARATSAREMGTEETHSVHMHVYTNNSAHVHTTTVCTCAHKQPSAHM